jgi:hypothetical protein
MKAELGKRYAIIQNGRCHWKFDITTLPVWHDGLHVVELGTPEPDEGDLFDGVTFSKPAPLAPEVDSVEALRRALVRKGILTDVEIDAERKR